jgi:hypothetical protein
MVEVGVGVKVRVWVWVELGLPPMGTIHNIFILYTSIDDSPIDAVSVRLTERLRVAHDKVSSQRVEIARYQTELELSKKSMSDVRLLLEKELERVRSSHYNLQQENNRLLQIITTTHQPANNPKRRSSTPNRKKRRQHIQPPSSHVFANPISNPMSPTSTTITNPISPRLNSISNPKPISTSYPIPINHSTSASTSSSSSPTIVRPFTDECLDGFGGSDTAVRRSVNVGNHVTVGSYDHSDSNSVNIIFGNSSSSGTHSNIGSTSTPVRVPTIVRVPIGNGN